MYEVMNKSSYEVLEIYKQNFIQISDIKNYIRVIHSDDDIILKQIINSAIESCENYCGINLISKKIKFSISNINSDRISLPLHPSQSVIEIKIKSKNEEILDLKDISLNHKDGIINFKKNIYYKNLNIIYLTGFENPHLIPKSLIQGITMHVAQIYDSGSYQSISEDLERLYKPYRKMRI